MDWHYEDIPVNSIDNNLSLGILGTPVYESNTVKIIDSPGFGRTLYINNSIQTCEFDEYIYHEMMVHPALSTQVNPKKILIIGGGDGGALREVLKYDSVEKVDFVEVSKEVIEASVKHLKFMELAKNIQDPRVSVYIGDGAKFIKSAKLNSYNVILVDGNDPVGPATSLYTPRFIKDCRDRLAPNGVLTIQCGYHLTSPKFVKEIRYLMRENFKEEEYFSCPIPTYPSGGIGFLLGSRKGSLNISGASVPTRYFDVNTLKSSLIKPKGFTRNSRHENFKLIYKVFDWSEIIKNYADFFTLRISNRMDSEPSHVDGVNIPLVRFSIGMDDGKSYYKLRVSSLSKGGRGKFKEALMEKYREFYSHGNSKKEDFNGFEWDSRNLNGGSFIFSFDIIDSIRDYHPDIYSNFPEDYHNFGFLEFSTKGKGAARDYSATVFQPKRILKINKEGIRGEHKITEDSETIKRKVRPLTRNKIDFLGKNGLTPSSLMYKTFKNYEIGFEF